MNYTYIQDRLLCVCYHSQSYSNDQSKTLTNYRGDSIHCFRMVREAESWGEFDKVAILKGEELHLVSRNEHSNMALKRRGWGEAASNRKGTPKVGGEMEGSMTSDFMTTDRIVTNVW